MRQIYDFFLYKLVRQGSLTQVLKRLRFPLLIRENICYQKSTPHFQRYRESTSCIVDMENHRLPMSYSVDRDSCKHCILLIQRVTDAQYCWNSSWLRILFKLPAQTTIVGFLTVILFRNHYYFAYVRERSFLQCRCYHNYMPTLKSDTLLQEIS